MRHLKLKLQYIARARANLMASNTAITHDEQHEEDIALCAYATQGPCGATRTAAVADALLDNFTLSLQHLEGSSRIVGYAALPPAWVRLPTDVLPAPARAADDAAWAAVSTVGRLVASTHANIVQWVTMRTGARTPPEASATLLPPPSEDAWFSTLLIVILQPRGTLLVRRVRAKDLHAAFARATQHSRLRGSAGTQHSERQLHVACQQSAVLVDGLPTSTQPASMDDTPRVMIGHPTTLTMLLERLRWWATWPALHARFVAALALTASDETTAARDAFAAAFRRVQDAPLHPLAPTHEPAMLSAMAAYAVLPSDTHARVDAAVPPALRSYAATWADMVRTTHSWRAAADAAAAAGAPTQPTSAPPSPPLPPAIVADSANECVVRIGRTTIPSAVRALRAGLMGDGVPTPSTGTLPCVLTCSPADVGAGLSLVYNHCLQTLEAATAPQRQGGPPAQPLQPLAIPLRGDVLASLDALAATVAAATLLLWTVAVLLHAG